MTSMSAPVESANRSSTLLHNLLWIAQAILAGIHGAAGVMKVSASLADLAVIFAWTSDASGPLIRFIGATELAAAAGLLVPSWAQTRIGQALTPIAAGAIAIAMMCASLFHFARGEALALRTTLLLCGLAAFVAWGRYRSARAGRAPDRA